MAGEMGARALELMNNPNEIARVQGWMAKFGMTNQGMQWNQAKMMMSQPAPPQEGKVIMIRTISSSSLVGWSW